MNSKNNILLGLDADSKKLFVENNDYRHILLIAPHGSGKGVCFVIPSLLSFEESAIVHDIKMENYELTSGYRASRGHKIFMFNPLGGEGKTNRYNPLDFISADPTKIIDDVEKIAHLLIKDCSDYSAQAKNLFTSLVLYLAANAAKTKSLGEIARMLSNDLIAEITDATEKLKTNGTKTLHPFAISQIKSFLSKDKHEQNSIIRVLSRYLAPWNNPLIDYATSTSDFAKSDFDFADFKKNKTPVVGMVQRGGRVIAKIQNQLKFKDLKKTAGEHIDFSNTVLMTDDYRGYIPFKHLLTHQTVNHSQKQFANGIIHTNTIENFWSILKRGITGQYHHLSDKYLNKYIIEFCFRYNNRTNTNLFNELLTNAIGA